MSQLASPFAAGRDVSATRPLRCGVIGTGAQARFHREALSIRDSFQLVDADAELLFIASSVNDRVAHAIATLNAGQHVVIEVPVALSVSETAAVFETAAERRLHCEVWLPRRQQLDFLQALNTLRTGMIGELRQATLTLRQLAPWMLPRPESSPRQLLDVADDEQALGVLATFGWHYFDQLLEFVDSQPTRVWGRLSNAKLSFDALADCGSVAGIDTGFIAVIEFSNGCVGQVEIDLASSLSLGPSWTLQGQRGGYATGRQSITVSDGEVYDVSVESTPCDPYSELLARLSDSGNRQAAEHSSDEVARLIDAIRRSSSTGNVVGF